MGVFHHGKQIIANELSSMTSAIHKMIIYGETRTTLILISKRW